LCNFGQQTADDFFKDKSLFYISALIAVLFLVFLLPKEAFIFLVSLYGFEG
jgi:hypothetical protein